MLNHVRCFLAIAVLFSTLPTIALAVPAGAEVAATVQPTAPASAAVQAPVIYLVQPQAAAAPATAQASSGVVGVLAAVPVETWALLLGLVALVVMRLLGEKGDRVRAKVDTWIDLAYYAAEAAARAAAPGSVLAKAPLALDAFHRGLLGEGIAATAADDQRAQAAWQAKAAAEKVEADIRVKAHLRANEESVKQIKAQATAGELLAEAAKA